MHVRKHTPSARHCAWLLAAVAAAALTACGGGEGDAPATGAQASASPATPQGRAQRLAATLPTGTPAPAGLAGNIRCTDWIVGAVTVDNVQVPPGSTCRLEGTRVLGSVQVEQGAYLLATGADVAGSVQGQGAAHLQLAGGRVAGGVQMEGGGSGSVRDTAVAGDLAANGLLDLLEVVGAQVGGNLQVTDNLGGGSITGNRVRGNLQCTGNQPAPLAADNSAALIEGQCRPAGGGGGGGGGGTPPGTPPLSGNVSCVGLTIGAITLDTVTVPPGTSCTLLGTRLLGNLEVGAGSRLIADSVAITGGVVADGARELAMGGSSTIGGSLQVQRGLAATLAGLSVTGNLQIDAMAGPVSATGNRAGGNLQATANLGGLVLIGNTLGGVMQCKDNRPAPTGSGNTATLKEDQCRRL